jgi:hypothetical protein
MGVQTFLRVGARWETARLRARAGSGGAPPDFFKKKIMLKE